MNDAENYKVGRCWAYCDACGAGASMDGGLPPLEHRDNCCLKGMDAPPPLVCTAVDVENGIVTFSGIDRSVDPVRLADWRSTK